MSFTLHQGDAVAVMREKIATRSIDMVYSDPPFGNEQVWKGKAGSFDDRWDASDASRRGWNALQQHSPAASVAALACHGDKKTLAFIGVMAGIILEVHRVLKPTGTLWLHFDDTMGSELRLLCDVVFGPQNAAGTLVWKRTEGGKGNANKFGRVHDTIACSRTPWNAPGAPGKGCAGMCSRWRGVREGIITHEYPKRRLAALAGRPGRTAR